MTALYGLGIGMLYSVMNLFNAGVSGAYGAAFAPVLIHLAGAMCLWPLSFTAWGKRAGKAPWYLYTGGAMGVVTVVASNLGVTALGVTVSLALMLLGQLLSSAVCDQLGLFGAKRVKTNGLKALGIAVIGLGAGVMIYYCWEAETGGVAVAVGMLLFSGFTIVLQRIVNAMLAAKAGVGHSTVMNHTTGLAASLALFAVSGFAAGAAFPVGTLPFYYYLGGPLGALSIFALNHITKRLPNVRLTLLLFVGQAASGMLIDALILGRFSRPILIATLLVAAGLAVNTAGDRRANREAA
jgi:transporter family-2 protein